MNKPCRVSDMDASIQYIRAFYRPHTGKFSPLTRTDLSNRAGCTLEEARAALLSLAQRAIIRTSGNASSWETMFYALTPKGRNLAQFIIDADALVMQKKSRRA